MNTQRYNAADVHKAIRRLNMDAGRPVERFKEYPKGTQHNIGHFDCDKSGSAFWKLYEVVNVHGGERTIAYAQTAQLACTLIDVYRQGFHAGVRQESDCIAGCLV